MMKRSHQAIASFCRGNILENLPPKLLLWLFGLHPQSVSICTNLVLQTRNDADGEILLSGPQPVCRPNHLGAFHGLGMPVVPVQPALQVGVPLCLEEIVIVALLVEEVQVIVLAVVPDLLDHCPHAGFPLRDQFGILQLLALEVLHHSLLLGKGTLELGNSGS